jgi:hypothetical protein
MFTLQRKSPWFFLMGCVLGVPWAICWHYTRQLAHFYVWPFIIPFVIHSDPSYGRHILIYPSLPGMILSILTLIVANYGLQGGYSSRRMWIAFWLGLAFMMVLFHFAFKSALISLDLRHVKVR